ncbi:DNA-3-methyladenine glycosylase I [Thalassotalea agarivorans]|uniref:DNA-3-methyladenine glycosylase I n=1 Tax=Thalassotalea agarivorans TaxID=349064 RepID=A0A1I0GA60_THASX|nr:DNA-3-methyladenine glycosylase I [Thalassotalea agarivorans]SET67647.1 DNA-3-methyladenine glycosylase I [Thalassotalea agarivorans]
MALESVDSIFQRAAERKGGEHKLLALMGEGNNDKYIAKLGDDRLLAEFTKKVFQSGFVWRVVEKKWPDFEEVFFHFDIEKILMMPEEMLERKASDERIIRNYNKVKTIKQNAQMMFEEQQNGHSFAEFVANWPSEDIIGLWAYLKKHGARLGGNTGPYALRTIGKDTFLLSRDVEAYFRASKLIDGGLQTKKSLHAIQDTFSTWQQQSGYSLSQLSRLVSYATGDNHIQL